MDTTTQPSVDPEHVDQAPGDATETDIDEPNHLDAIRQLVLRAHPDVVPELIAGESVETLLASVGPAREAYQRLASRIGAPPAVPAVPAGGDRPAVIDPDRLPSSEKIRRGLARAT